jgi:hypothetical protein
VQLNRPGFCAASFLVRKDAIMTSITTSRSRLAQCDWLPNTRLNPGSVTKSCEGIVRSLEIARRRLIHRGSVAPTRTPVRRDADAAAARGGAYDLRRGGIGLRSVRPPDTV